MDCSLPGPAGLGRGQRRAVDAEAHGHAWGERLGRRQAAGAQLGHLFMWGGQGEVVGGWRRPSVGKFQCNCIWTLKRNCVEWAVAARSAALFGVEMCLL